MYMLKSYLMDCSLGGGVPTVSDSDRPNAVLDLGVTHGEMKWTLLAVCLRISMCSGPTWNQY